MELVYVKGETRSKRIRHFILKNKMDLRIRHSILRYGVYVPKFRPKEKVSRTR